ncbi:MAG: putative ABC transporter ATP-binding protein [Candidatus Izimaplasma bacterium HR2]|nr:MAG: putative ABC transporter ATP-binding protein [Candidatus Izimaplasma bacterium HR2]
MNKQEKMKMKKQEMMKNMKKPVDPFKEYDHKNNVLDKIKIKKRNEATKDYSKEMNKTQGRSRGPGRTMYLGGKASDTRGTALRIWRYLGKYQAGLIVVIIGVILTSALGALIPWLFAKAIDDYILLSDFSGAVNIAMILVFIALFTSIVRFIARYTMAIISQRTVKKIRKDAFDKLQKLSVNYYDTNQAGDIVSRITNDVDLISNSLSTFTIEMFGSVVTLIVSLFMMFYVNWALAIVVILFVPIMVFFTMKVSKVTRKGFVAQQKHLGALNSITEESISGLKIIKLYSQESEIINEYGRKNEELRKAGFKAQVWAGVIMPVINFMNNFIYLLIAAMGGLLAISGKVAITVGDISAITMYARQFIRPIANLAQLFNSLQQGLAGAERVFSLIDEEDEYVGDGDVEVEKFNGCVQFNDVTFGYVKDKIVLKNISFEAPAGETVAIVGPTGSGKTTIINLLNRFYDINSGSIEIDNININTYKKDDLRNKIGVVLQDTNLFSGTVYENIIYGDLTASKDKVINAAKMANAYDFIMKLPHGMDSEVYEGGQNFSQGERQLISIARTILSDPDILILDEATSNVDTRTEFKIQESMRTLMKGRTSFVIAHRLQTIRNAHKIIVINDGMLIESGTHHELLEYKGFYYDLYTTQFKDLVKDLEG